MIRTNKSGFSLVEVLLTIVLIGVVSGLCYPVVVNLLEKCKDESAICSAECVNAAKKSFWMRNPRAEQEYMNQTSDAAKYALIKDYLPDPSTTFDRALPKGYQLKMNARIRSRVGIFKGNSELEY